MTEDRGSSFGLPLRVAIHTDVGSVRDKNEDSAGHAWIDDELFVIVADGMGGHEAGEVASGLAVDVLGSFMSEAPGGDPRQRLYGGLLAANQAILDEGAAKGSRGMGTTAIAALMQGPKVFVGLVGDSRLYHIRRGALVWRTQDHTRVQNLIDKGLIDEEDAREHPEAGMLTRALGHNRMANGEDLVPDVFAEPIELEAEDALLLCSDGLHDLLDDWEISQMVAGREPNEAARDLVDLACDRGGHDNITVAVITAGDRAGAFDPEFAGQAGGVVLEQQATVARSRPWAANPTIPPTLQAEVQIELTRDLPHAQAVTEEEPPRRALWMGIAAMSAAALVGVALIAAAIGMAAAWWWSA